MMSIYLINIKRYTFYNTSYLNYIFNDLKQFNNAIKAVNIKKFIYLNKTILIFNIPELPILILMK